MKKSQIASSPCNSPEDGFGRRRASHTLIYVAILTIFIGFAGAPQAAAQCGPFPITSGQTLTGTLSASCPSSLRTGAYAVRYTFSATAGQTITIAMNATTFVDTYLYLLGPANNLVAFDDDSGGNFNSLISYTAAATGTYTIEATSFVSATTGTFTISLNLSGGGGGGGSCGPLSITSGQTLTGTLSTGCPSALHPGAYAVRYTFNATAGQAITIAMNATTFVDTFLYLLGPSNTVVAFDDDSGGNLNSLITTTAGATGTYTIEATSFSTGITGNFTISLTLSSGGGGGGGGSCAAVPIANGQTLGGSLSSSCPSSLRLGAYAQRYTFSANAGQSILIALNSSVFDTFLYLLGPSGNVVTYDDDSGGNLNSLIIYTAASTGTYTIEATSYSSGVTGAFTLTLNVGGGGGGGTCSPTPITSGQTLSGTLSSSCPSSLRFGAYQQRYTFSATVGQSITVAVNSVAFDTYAYLINSGGIIVAQDDDSGGNLNSLIAYTAGATDTYTIEVTSFSSGFTGAFTVSLTVSGTGGGGGGTCTTTAISSGQTLTGNLTSACQSTQRLGAYAQRFTFSATAGQVATITMTSNFFDTYLYLFGPASSTTPVAFDDDSAGNLNSRIIYTVASSGTHTIEATSYSSGSTGSFTLSLVLGSGGGGGCTPTAITSGQTMTGSLSATCQSTHRLGSFAQLFTFNATAGQTITVAQNSTAFDSYLFLLGPSNSVVAQDDDSGGNLNSRIVYTAAASGTYTIEATSYAASTTGSFTVTLTIGSGGGGGCTVTPITTGQTINGTLSAGCASTHRLGSYAQLYSFSATTGQVITVAENSSAFDTYLFLVGPTNTVVAFDDDSGGNLNSRIQYTAVASGTYTIEATSYSSGVTGGFSLTLTVASGGTASCSPTAITSGQTLTDTLASNCTAADRPGSYARLFTFSATAGQTMTIAMNSTAFDTYLYLKNPSNVVVAQDDDSGGNLNSRIVLTAATSGTYTIEATSYSSGAVGSFTVTLTITSGGGGGGGCASTSISSGQSLSGTLSSSCVSTRRIGSFSQFYTFSANAGQTITVAMNSNPIFDTYLYLLGPGSVQVAYDDDSGGNLQSRIVYVAAVSGTYTIEATSYAPSVTGSFTVTLTVSGTGGGGGCTPTAITSGQTLNGILVSTCPSSVRLGAYAQRFTFSATAGQTVTVTENSSQFDTYAFLLGPTNTVVAQDDDSGGNLNSRIIFTATSSGTYTIEATSYSIAVTGSFTVSLTLGTSGGGSGCTPTAITSGQSVNGTLSSNCISTRRSGSYSQFYTFSATAGQGITIAMNGTTFTDTYLYLIASSTVVAFDDDSGGNLNARITYTAASSGTYTIEATSYASATSGNYTLTLTIGTGGGGTCAATAITSGQTLNGTLTTSCPSTHRLGSFAQYFSFSATTGQSVTVAMNSIGVGGIPPASQFDTYVFLVGPSGTVVAQDDDSGGNLNSRITYTTVASGTYTIEATSYSSNVTGNFTVTLTLGSGGGGTTCTTTAITSGQTVNGSLTSSCPSSLRSGRYAQRYSFSASAGQIITVAENSSQFDTYLYLVGPGGSVVAQDDDSGGNLNSRIIFTATVSGTYVIEATSYSSNVTGSFTVTLTIGGAGGGGCAANAITTGQTVSGTLVSTCPSLVRPGSYALRYTFSANAGQTITISMTAVNNSFDTYLYLIGPAGSIVASDDDSGGGLNSRIMVPAATTGTYTIEATTYGAGVTGSFTLTLTVGAGTTSGIVTLLMDASPFFGALQGSTQEDVYQFVVDFPAKYVMETNNPFTNTELLLFGPNSATNQLAFDDDSGMGLASKITIDLDAGTYYLHVRGHAGATGNYGVSVRPYGEAWDLKVAFEWTTPPLGDFEPQFRMASNWVYDATDGQFRLKNLDVYRTTAGFSYDWLTADVQIVQSQASCSQVHPRLIFSGSVIQICSSSTARSAGVIAHELGHYKFHLFDEYTVSRCSTNLTQPCNAQCFAGGGTCINANTNATLARSCPASATDATTYRMCLMTQSTTGVTVPLSEFCTPDKHATSNDQEEQNHESCWSTIRRYFTWVNMPLTAAGIDLKNPPVSSLGPTQGTGGLVVWLVH